MQQGDHVIFGAVCHMLPGMHRHGMGPSTDCFHNSDRYVSWATCLHRVADGIPFRRPFALQMSGNGGAFQAIDQNPFGVNTNVVDTVNKTIAEFSAGLSLT